MNFSTGKFDYGSWEDVWFMQGNHVYAIDSNGNRYKQCQDDDYSKFADLSATDISSSSSPYNYMASFPLCWIHRSMNGNKRIIKIANKKVDNTYHAYGWEDENGNVQDYFYVGIFKASTISGKSRSLANQPLAYGLTNAQEITNTSNNGKGYYPLDHFKFEAIKDLITLISKNTNNRSTFGVSSDYSRPSTSPNTLNRGRFFGSSSYAVPSLFHIYGLYGDESYRIVGVMVNGKQKTYHFKTHGPYSATGTGYTKHPTLVFINNTGNISSGIENEYGFFPTALNGSLTTYECTQTHLNTYGYDVLIAPLKGAYGISSSIPSTLFYEYAGFTDNQKTTWGMDDRIYHYLAYTPQGTTSNPSA